MMCNVTYPQCHEIMLAITTTIIKNTNPPAAPPITAPTLLSSDESSPLFGTTVTVTLDEDVATGERVEEATAVAGGALTVPND